MKQTEAMTYPPHSLCQLAYRKIQAHCAIRLSTRVGDQLRSIAGTSGDIGAFSTNQLQMRFGGAELAEAQRLVQLAIHNRRRIKDENNNQDRLSDD